MTTSQGSFDVNEYMDRIAKHVASLPNNAARAQFLRARIEKIDESFCEAERKAARGEQPKVSAWDYSILLAELHKALAPYQQYEAA